MKRVYLSKTDKKLGGVCGGIAETLDIDATLLRLVFVAALLSPLPAGLFYILCWIVMPRDPGYLTR